MTQASSKNPGEKLEEQLSGAELRANNSEAILTQAQKELAELSSKAGDNRYSGLETRLSELASENQELAESLKNFRTQLEQYQKDAAHWRGQFLLSQIDMVSEIDRAEKAEQKLSAAVLPVPYDQRQLIVERDLSWMAFTDPITHLGNANKLDLVLETAVQTSLVKGQLAVLFVIDIDRFRAVNEFAGWSQGNEVLERMAGRLVDNIPSTTEVVRRAEDEFALVTTLDASNYGELGSSPLVRVRQIADFLLKLLSEPLELNKQPFPITVSIGISACPDDADTPLELLENAYAALASAKERGGNKYVIYNDKVYAEKEHRASLAAELKQAIKDETLLFHYRPIVDVQRGNLAAAIVVPYWEHPAHGRVDQDHFMPVAEEYGLMPELVRLIVGAGCELSRKMKGSITTVLRCPSSVLNLHGFNKAFMESVNAARIKPNSLILDLPGQALVDFPGPLTQLFSELGRWGIGRSLGLDEKTPLQLTGLQQASISLLNLAPEMLASVPSQESRRSVVQCYLDSAKRLKIPILVNGVGDSTQAHFLALHQCDWVSGDFLSPSLSLNDFIAQRRATWKLK